MASGEGSPGSPGADQSLRDMAASWQSLIDSVNQRRQPAPATPKRQRNPLERLRNQLRQAQIPFLPRRNPPHTREPASPLDGVRLDRSTRTLLDRSRRNPSTAEPAPAAPESARWQSLAKAVGKGVGTGILRYAENVSPHTFLKKAWEGDYWWLIGGSVGFGVTVGTQIGVGYAAAVKAGLPVGTGLANIGINVARGIIEARSKQELQGDQARLQARLEEINKKFPVASQRLKRFAAGFSAGTLYGSMFTVTGAAMAAADITKSVVEEVMKSGSDFAGEAGKLAGAGISKVKETVESPPDVLGTVGKIPETVSSKYQEITAGETVTAPAAEPLPDAAAGSGETLVQTREALEALTQTKEYQDSIAATVGNHLDLTDQAVNEAIKGMGVDPAKVSKQAFEHARQQAQHFMEYAANSYFNPNNYPDIDFSGRPFPLAGLKEGFAQKFDDFISTPGEMSRLQQIARDGLMESFYAEMVSSEPFKQSVAAAVGAHLDTVTNNTVNEVLASRGLDPGKLPPEALQKMHDALRHQMENYANFEFNSLAETAAARGILDTQLVAAEGNKLFADFLNSQQAHDQLVKTATEALGQPTQIPSFDLSSLSPADLTEQVIPNNTTVGHMLFEAGVQTGWGADNAELFAAEIAANYDLLGSPIPLSELKSLVADAQNGDVEALKKLHAALRLIPAGSKFNILSKAGVTEVLARLPG